MNTRATSHYATPFAERFGLRLPLVQAPMVGATTPALVVAASNAGALGSLGAGAMAPEKLAAEVAEIRGATSRPFGVNLFVLDPIAPDGAMLRRALDAIDPLRAELGLPPGRAPERYAPALRAQLEQLIALRVPIASFTFGVLEAADVERLKAAGTYVIGTATHVAEGIAWRDAGADAVCAQGAEAGGHRGTFIDADKNPLVGTMALVPQLVDALRIPVLAAGGIMDGRGIAAALALGAQAAQLGTAFLPCAESAIAQDWRKRLAASSDTATSVTRAITGRYARGIRNTLMDRLEAEPARVAPYPVQNALTQELRQAAARADRGDYLSLWAGQGAPLLRGRRPGCGTAELIDALDAEWRAASSRVSRAAQVE
ncbi:NAD(P)H-dependent flavin oxidoreductase [Trinickia acidisoli]|uniref:NAD(P)H-dependent flavin oxidoreductase n=1 Tax=Trinickia acidisoli TaxID=2767482 RepID=UPI001A8ED8B1|nr:nitronate monooxygenase [Trinickia acidisoli]